MTGCHWKPSVSIVPHPLCLPYLITRACANLLPTQHLPFATLPYTPTLPFLWKKKCSTASVTLWTKKGAALSNEPQAVSSKTETDPEEAAEAQSTDVGRTPDGERRSALITQWAPEIWVGN